MTTNERPIIMSAGSMRAILDGRKTQTRRVIKPQPEFVWGQGIRNSDPEHYAAHVRFPGGSSGPDPWITCPYGLPGDHLWVRETWGAVWPDEYPVPLSECRIEYRADLPDGCTDQPGEWPAEDARGDPEAPKWRPSIFMPRWASRITLAIVGVRVKRLQDISGTDACAEGITPVDPGGPVRQFADLWDALNAKRGHGWDVNPWVWVIEFRRIEA